MLLIRLVLRTLVGMIGLWLAATFVPGVTIEDNATLLVAALIMGVVNAVVRPLVFVMTLPVTFLTLGLFLLVVNAAMFSLTAWFIDGFTVAGFWPAVFGAVVLGLVNWIGQTVIGPRDEARAD
jgi:putative membrane protein